MNLPQKMLGYLRVVGRCQTLLWTLSRFGILGSLTSLGLEFGRRGVRWINPKKIQATDYDEVFGRNLAPTFQEMGPTFIKLGQVLATRTDIVGDPVAGELQVLFSRVRPVPFRQVKKILVRELGREKVRSEFRDIEQTPLGSASIGQTHRGTLKDGTPVVIKVQKPGVADTVKLDLMLLESVAKSASVAFPKLGIVELFNDFKASTEREIDYREEAKNIQRFKKNYRRLFSTGEVVFPGFYPQLSTSQVIVLEPMRGKPVLDLNQGTRTASQAAHKSLSAVFEQIFEHGFFHADPHGANMFFIEEEGRLGFIDLGLVGQLDPKDKKLFVRVLMAIIQRDRKVLAESLFNLGTPGSGTVYDNFDKDIQTILDEVKAVGLEKIKLDKMVNQVLGAARKHEIYIPNRYIMMIRSCLVIEGVAKNLDPKVSVMKVALPVVARSLLKSYNPFRR